MIRNHMPPPERTEPGNPEPEYPAPRPIDPYPRPGGQPGPELPKPPTT